jgi:hypothetical protein
MTAETKLIKTQAGVWYSVYVNDDNNLCWVKSSDGGFVWSDPVVITEGMKIDEISVNINRNDEVIVAYTVADGFMHTGIEPIDGEPVAGLMTIVYLERQKSK